MLAQILDLAGEILAAIGDDTLQRQSQGVVVPESFTHGSSAQRMAALRTGLQSGDPNACHFNQ